MWNISKAILTQVCTSARNFYPKEFLCFLAGDKKTQILTEIVLLPHTSGADFASIYESVIPIDDSILCNIHSHPDSTATPSSADKVFFRKYDLNGIIDGTYSPEQIRFFNNKGEPISIIITP